MTTTSRSRTFLSVGCLRGSVRLRPLHVLGGFAAALAVVAALLYAVGPARVVALLADARPFPVAGAVAAILAAQACFALAFGAAVHASGVRVPPARAGRAFAAGAFFRRIAPMEAVGGPLAAAYAFRERDLQDRAVVAGVVTETAGVVATLAIVGAAGAVLTTQSGYDPGLRAFAGAVAAVCAVGLAVAVLLVARPRLAGRAASALARGLGATVGRVAPGPSRWVARKFGGERSGNYRASVRSFAADRRAVAVVLALSVAGWLLYALTLAASAAAVGVSASLATVAFAALITGVLSALPLPGGVGGVEVGLVAVLAAFAGASLAAGAAAVLLFRLVSYWFVLLLAGVVFVAWR